MPLLELTPSGLYCSAGDFFIDPWRSVEKAIITHAHSDHARRGMKSYLSHHHSAPSLRLRLGNGIRLQTVDYGEPIRMGSVLISLHPAGHIPGSAQVRVEYQGEIWVVSGDYKLENDRISVPFEPVSCHTFITEATFGLPIYQWPDQDDVFRSIHAWWRTNQEKGLTSVLTAYSLGKAQRLMKHLNPEIGPVWVHHSIEEMNNALTDAGILQLPETSNANLDSNKKLQGPGMVLAPPSAIQSPWIRRFEPFAVAFVSGWMQVGRFRKRQTLDAGFVLSDHADWPGLLEAVQQTGAENVLVTHGISTAFSRFLKEKGINAEELNTEFAGEAGSS